MSRKYKRHKNIPFNGPQPERIYQKIRRAENPLKKAIELKAADIPELKKLMRDLANAISDGLIISAFVVILTYFFI